MPERSQLRAVLDTNVFVSGLMGVNSPPRQIVDAWLDGRLTLVTSLYLVDELAHMLSYPRITERIPLDESEVDAILAALLSQAEMTPGKLALPGVTRDQKDDAVVACSVEGEADYIVSGDENLLVLDVYKDIKIVTPRQFMSILEAN
jgi:hypothetical protein